MEKRSKNRRPVKPSSAIKYTVLTMLALIYVLPLLWIVMVSLKTNAEIFSNPFGWPDVLQLGNYIFAWNQGMLGTALKNSFIICFITLFFSLFIGSMAAFGIARMRWKLSGPTFVYFLIGMMVPVHCVLIPLFVTIIPYITFALPMIIFILTNFYKGIPGELFDAACIDGCSIYKAYFSIALPLAKTGLMVTGMMTFVNTWNELLVAMVFISDPAKKTLPVTLTYFVGPYATNYSQMFAAIVISVIPTIIVYCAFSNQIVDGLTQGAIKG